MTSRITGRIGDRREGRRKFERRGQPLTSLKVIVSLIAGTTTRMGLKVHAEVNDQYYPPGIKVSDAEIDKINLRREEFHGEWNYEILPRV